MLALQREYPFTFIVSIEMSSAVAELGDRLATTDMGQKAGGGCCGGAGSPCNIVAWAEA